MNTRAPADLSLETAKQQIEVTFHVDSPTAVLAWGAHIAQCSVWGTDANDKCRSAGGISGSPYHMRQIDWTLNNLGNQDRSMKASAVVAPGDLILAKEFTGDTEGYSGDFRIDYNCGPNYTGYVDVPAGSSVPVPGIPAGTQCTISETLPADPEGYEFGTPTFTPPMS